MTYADETPRELEALVRAVTKLGRPELLPLDRTHASLDRLEDYCCLVLDGGVPGSRKLDRERVARYVGATLIEQAGGRWEPGPHGNDAFVVKGTRAAPEAVFDPAQGIAYFEQWRFAGILRDRTERHDLELQRRTIAELAGDLAATLARLRSDVKTLTGTDPGPLDGTEALTRYEPALGRVRGGRNAPRDLRRASSVPPRSRSATSCRWSSVPRSGPSRTSRGTSTSGPGPSSGSGSRTRRGSRFPCVRRA